MRAHSDGLLRRWLGAGEIKHRDGVGALVGDVGTVPVGRRHHRVGTVPGSGGVHRASHQVDGGQGVSLLIGDEQSVPVGGQRDASGQRVDLRPSRVGGRQRDRRAFGERAASDRTDG